MFVHGDIVVEIFAAEGVTSCVVVVAGLHDVGAVVVEVADAEKVVEPFAEQLEALVKELAFDVEVR